MRICCLAGELRRQRWSLSCLSPERTYDLALQAAGQVWGCGAWKQTKHLSSGVTQAGLRQGSGPEHKPAFKVSTVSEFHPSG